jgi:hypothetical protein
MPKKKQKHKKRQNAAAVSRPALVGAIICAVAAVALRMARHARAEPLPRRLTRGMRVRRARRAVPCRAASVCGARPCDRVVMDDWLPAHEIEALRGIARRGADKAGAAAAQGGPTIVDINSGFVMAPGARLANLYQTKGVTPFSGEDYALYRSVIRRLKAEVEGAFPRASSLYFTAPTFLTWLSGENATWAPLEPHDEYYQWHVDRDNTPHYEFSGLLYLSDYGADFGGGLFAFEDGTSIEPRRGRLSMFAAGAENRHRVARVTRGQRLTLSFWFACDPAYEFADFLDGEVHAQFRS